MNFQERIDYHGELPPLLHQVTKDYDLGEYQSHSIIPIGYEDLNIVLDTNTGKYLVKAFNTFRTPEDCQRYVDVMQNVMEAGIAHPRVFTSDDEALHEITLNEASVRLCVLQFIQGSSFYSLNEQPTFEELMFITRQAAMINQLNIKPTPIYDDWACTNFLSEFESKKSYLDPDDYEMVAPLADQFSKLNLEELPKTFVHGDIIKTNVIRAENGQIYIIDFSVSNVYPRIQELAVLLCDLFFNEKDPSNFPYLYEECLKEYQKLIKLMDAELAALPLYTKVAHAMHIVLPNHQKKVMGNSSSENELWLDLGRRGLQYTNSIWK